MAKAAKRKAAPAAVTAQGKPPRVRKERAVKDKPGKGGAEKVPAPQKAGKKPVAEKRKGEARRAVAEWNIIDITADSEWPITTGGFMQTPTFRPSEEEFADFHAYMQKLDRLVGHMGVCKVIPPPGWQPRKYDVYNLEDSLPELEESVTVSTPPPAFSVARPPDCHWLPWARRARNARGSARGTPPRLTCADCRARAQVKRPIKQNAIGGKGLYVNVHEEKRSMKLSEFKRAAKSKEFAPPVDGAGARGLSDAEVDQLERYFWRNVLFNAPMYGADCPAPRGFRPDGREGLFDPAVCGSWDLGNLPSLLTTGVKRRVPGVNTPFLYVGMYRAAFAWHCEDMDLHSINYLHWGCPKTWYTVPATHGKKLEALARLHFPLQAGECREFLRHKTNMLEPQQLVKAGIPLTRTVQKAGEFIINFPGAYHSGFNNGYNCAESCNFATEYWVPFGVQARPCGCAGRQNSVSIDVDAMLRRCQDVKVKGEQWVQCEECDKWRLLPPYMMHLMAPDTRFVCGLIEDMSCGKKEAAGAWEGEGQWEVDGKVQIGLDPDLEQWVLCEVPPCPPSSRVV
jgi:hypothetical protein